MFFKRTDLGTAGTPLSKIEEYSGTGYSSPLFIKREELCATEWNYGCSDMRKLEFILVELSLKGTTDVVMYSRYGSHFTRQAALVLSRFGVTVHCMFSDQFSPIYAQNLSLLHMAGAETYGTRTHKGIMDLVDRLIEAGRSVSVLDIGGHRSIAPMGGFALFDEVKLDLNAKFDLNEAVVYVGVDSGATMAGMLAASAEAKKYGEHDITIVGVPMFDSEDSYDEARTRVLENYSMLNELAVKYDVEFSVPELSADDVVFSDSKLPRGKIDEPLVRAAKEYYNQSGVMLDPIHGFHTAMAALIDSSDGRHGTKPIVFVNPSLPIIPYFQYNDSHS